jgi:hypothetical protein
MTAVIRYVTNTMDAWTHAHTVDSTGSDYQLVAFDITTIGGIDAGANADILTWTGSGKIKSILTISAKVIADGDMIPMSMVKIDPTGKIINVSIPTDGAAIPENSLISLILVIGNY